MSILQLEIKQASELKSKPASEENLGFGKIFTDHMFMMDYKEGKWINARIVPYGKLAIDPASTVLHYGQEIFEGLKAYHEASGRTLLFRAKDNFRRMNISAERMCLPQLDVEFVYLALCELLKIEKAWIPKSQGTSLYIRPTMFGNQEFLGVHPASEVTFFIICSPSGAYFAAGGCQPVGIYVEDSYVRAVKGGTGFAKTGGNYASSLIACQKAEAKGYSQVLWLDGIEHKYIEEVGAMNIFFKINGEVITPALEGNLLAGITRDSVIQLLKHKGIKITERKLTLQEVLDAEEAGTLEEIFGTGTAAVIAPVGKLAYLEQEIVINNNQTGPLAQELYDTLTGMQWGKIPALHGWSTDVK
ncbi:MAG: branched-chain amino acid aminotransferase [Clostridia bacterium]